MAHMTFEFATCFIITFHYSNTIKKKKRRSVIQQQSYDTTLAAKRLNSNSVIQIT